ncbi:MAG: putative toxin-antitoxin system toxin component, PIN family [Pirellulaceae bacterium]|nr:putative toxin-antitoxin system toxin component, PIN family [Pirellulaceae bacterium]
MSLKTRCVFDTSAIVSAVLFEQSVLGQAFYAALERSDLLVSSATFAELSEVLRRKKFDRYLTLEDRERFLVMLLQAAILVEIREEVRACRDPKDDKFLELAISGAATCLVSGDEDLLVLNPFRNIAVMTPAAFIEWLSSATP